MAVVAEVDLVEACMVEEVLEVVAKMLEDNSSSTTFVTPKHCLFADLNSY